jgi:hypothetical protein
VFSFLFYLPPEAAWLPPVAFSRYRIVSLHPQRTPAFIQLQGLDEGFLKHKAAAWPNQQGSEFYMS